MSLEYGAIDDTFYFHFAANDTGGSGADGETPTCDVRLCGAAADAAPVYSPTPVLLTHATYKPGAHEVAIVASVANGFAAGNTYAAFCSLAVDSQNPNGVVGKFKLDRPPVDVVEVGGAAVAGVADFKATGFNEVVPDAAGVVAGLLGALQTHGDGGWATAAGFSTHDAAAVVSAMQAVAADFKATGFNEVVPDAAGVVAGLLGALQTHGDGGWATAAGFSTHDAAAVVSAMQAVAADFKATGFNEVVPDAAGVVAGLLGALQTHGDGGWATAAGFSTHDAAAVVSAMQAVAADFKATGFNEVVPDAAGVVAGLLGALQTHGDGGWATAAGFSTHDAAAVVSAMQAVAADFKANVSALATAVNLTAVGTVVAAALAILKADKVIDTDKTPWELVYYTQGAEQIPDNEIFRKALSQPDGSNVTSSDHIVGQEEHTT